MGTVAILGGGIGGLTSARVLKALGWQVEVFERMPTYSGNGTGFLLLENGIDILNRLGLSHILQVGQSLGQCELFDRQSLLLSQTELPAYGFYHPSFVRSLLAELPTDVVSWGQAVASVTHDGKRVSTVTLSSGRVIEADLFIACDGNRSVCRNAIFPHALGPDLVHEMVCYLDAPDLVSSLGHRFLKYHDTEKPLSVGLAPCSPTSLVWFIQASRDILHPRSTDHLVRQRLAKNLLTGWPELILELVERSDFSRSYHWRTADLDPLPSMVLDNLALLGDAAHPMLTFTSQGVASALTDALVLGDVLGAPTTPDAIPRALELYSKKRLPVVTAIQQHGRHLRENFLNRGDKGAQVEVPLTMLAALSG